MSTLSASLTDADEARARAEEDAGGPAAGSGPLRLLKHAGEGERITLPALATPGDIREAVQYLKKKPAGVSVIEALNDSKRRIFHPRKVAAYEFWGLVSRRGSHLLLTAFGWEFVRKLAPAVEAYRALLDSKTTYRSALEWIHDQKLDLVTYADLASYLSGSLDPPLEPRGVKELEEAVVCFFHLCQAAGLGTVTIGKRGKPARLRVEREELSAWVGPGSGVRARVRQSDAAPPPAATRATGDAMPEGPSVASTPFRLFISSGPRDSSLVAELRETLELIDIESHVCQRGRPEAASVPVAEAAVEALRRCAAGLIILTREDCEEVGGVWVLKQSVLVEVGAAFVLYSGRVLLLIEEGFEVSASLGALPCLTLRGDALMWDVGLALLRAMKGFKGGPARGEQAEEHPAHSL
jgi:hypothetical protein